MADQIPTSNAYSKYFNTNQCRSFAQTIVTTAVTQLTAQPCSEVILVNRTGATLSAFDQNYIGTNNKTVSAFAMKALLLEDLLIQISFLLLGAMPE